MVSFTRIRGVNPQSPTKALDPGPKQKSAHSIFCVRIDLVTLAGLPDEIYDEIEQPDIKLLFEESTKVKDSCSCQQKGHTCRDNSDTNVWGCLVKKDLP